MAARKPAARKAAAKPATKPAPAPASSVHTLTPGKTRRHLAAHKCPSGSDLGACPDCQPDGTCKGLRFAADVEV